MIHNLSEDDIFDLQEKASDMAEAGDRDGAIQLYSQLIGACPNTRLLHANRGNLYWKMGKYEAARADLDEEVRIAPKECVSYVARGQFRKKAGDDWGALQDCRKAAELAPESGWALMDRVDVMMDLRLWPDALKGVNEMLRRSPNDRSGLSRRAAIFSEIGEYEKALEDLTLAVTLDKGMNPCLHFQRGELRERVGNVKGALEDYESASKADPGNQAYLTMVRRLRRAS